MITSDDAVNTLIDVCKGTYTPRTYSTTVRTFKPSFTTDEPGFINDDTLKNKILADYVPHAWINE